MEKIFVDTNIVLDLLEKREGFFEEAQELFTLADQKKVKLFVSAFVSLPERWTELNPHFL